MKKIIILALLAFISCDTEKKETITAPSENKSTLSGTFATESHWTAPNGINETNFN